MPPQTRDLRAPNVDARPATVTLAAVTIYLLATLQLTTGVLAVYIGTFYTQRDVGQAYRYGGYDLWREAGTSFVNQHRISTIVNIMLGLVYLLLAVYVAKGRPVARIMSWVCIGGFGVLCQGSVMALNTFGGASTAGWLTEGRYNVEAVATALAELVPSWIPQVQRMLNVSVLGAAIVAVVVLALPASHAYFNRVPEWARRH